MPRTAPKHAYKIVKPIKQGFEISDPNGKGWIVGEIIGQGGFGCLYSASSKDDPKSKKYVLKIEPQENGPLFTESHFYTRVCKQNLLDDWKAQHRLAFLGIPRFISKGLFETRDGLPCRFLVMDRFHSSFEDCLNDRKFTPSDIPSIAIQTIDALEYIHSKDYVHADIKASNLLRADDNKFYLADFGLVTLYRIDGKHKPEKPNSKLRDNGTLEFCSRDAHAGLPPSRRGDMEILLFNLIHWLYRAQPNADQGPCAGLPWDSLIGDPKVRANVPKSVRDRLVDAKIEAMDPAKASILVQAVGLGQLSTLESLVRAIGALGYENTPDYSNYKRLLKALQKNLTTIPSSTSKCSNILTEVNNGDTRSPRGCRAVAKTADDSGRKTVDRGTPKSSVALKKSRKRADDGKCQSGREEIHTPSTQTTGPPIRRSERNRRPLVSFIFDSSSAEEDNSEPQCIPSVKPSPLKKKKVTTNRNDSKAEEQKGEKPTATTSARAIATQTSPNLLKQLEREERRRNFF
nr:vaccinia related kinase 1 [Hymenolepis microstoma]